MKRIVLTLMLVVISVCNSLAQDIQSDTWMATDALGRTMPTHWEAPFKNDGKPRTVGIFYVTWHTQNLHNGLPYASDVTEIINTDANATREWNNPQWVGSSFHWGEPEYGYFLSQDRYVIRHDMSMLADAGVDVVIFDVTNAVCYWDEWWVTLDEMQRMRAEGNRVPKFCFWAFNGNVITVVSQLYERIYKENKYNDLWFKWEGKPLLLYNGTPSVDANVGGGEKNLADYPQEVKDFFTLRTMWWGYYNWAGERYVGGEDKWAFGYDLGEKEVQELTPLERASRHNGQVEQMAVTPAQHPISNIGKSWRINTGEPALNTHDLPTSTYVPWAKKTVDHPEGWGIYFQDRWDEALSVDPPFIYINDWNEWTAGRYISGKDPGGNVPGPTGFIGRENPFYFVDQYNAEYNRTIQPMRDGYTDNYYMQMVQNIRRYKGVRPSPSQRKEHTIRIDGDFNDWLMADAVYYDTHGDIIHRDHPGYGNLLYEDNSGRNDIIECRTVADKQNVYFYVQTADTLTYSAGKHWMLLYIDADDNPATGFNGYDFLLHTYSRAAGRVGITRLTTGTDGKVKVSQAGMATCALGTKQIEIAVPRYLLGIKGKLFSLNFKWADNPSSPLDIISVCTSGDTAPNRRFAYRFTFLPSKM